MVIKMVEKISYEFRKYGASTLNTLGRVFSNIVKYISLLGGIYSIKEENIAGVLISVYAYSIADVVTESLRDIADEKRISNLEKELLKK